MWSEHRNWGGSPFSALCLEMIARTCTSPPAVFFFQFAVVTVENLDDKAHYRVQTAALCFITHLSENEV